MCEICYSEFSEEKDFNRFLSFEQKNFAQENLARTKEEEKKEVGKEIPVECPNPLCEMDSSST